MFLKTSLLSNCLAMAASDISTKSPHKRRMDTSLGEELVLQIITALPLSAALKARCVCVAWKRLVKEAGLEPLEAGVSLIATIHGMQQQKNLLAMFRAERALYTTSYQVAKRQFLRSQDEVSGEMHSVLVNWLILVHYKFKLNEDSLELAIHFIVSFMTAVQVSRRRYQTLGVAALYIACKIKQGFALRLDFLSDITDHSSLIYDIMFMESEICRRVNVNATVPLPVEFLPRFLKAAFLGSITRLSNFSKPYSIALFFLDVSFTDEACAGHRPSLLAAAAVVCALRVLGYKEWSPHLEYYTQHSWDTVLAVSNHLVFRGGSLESESLQLKYESARFGGYGKEDQQNGCFGDISLFYEQHVCL